MSRREIVWRCTFGAVAVFGYVDALILAGQGSVAPAFFAALVFATCAFMALDDAVEDI